MRIAVLPQHLHVLKIKALQERVCVLQVCLVCDLPHMVENPAPRFWTAGAPYQGPKPGLRSTVMPPNESLEPIHYGCNKSTHAKQRCIQQAGVLQRPPAVQQFAVGCPSPPGKIERRCAPGAGVQPRPQAMPAASGRLPQAKSFRVSALSCAQTELSTTQSAAMQHKAEAAISAALTLEYIGCQVLIACVLVCAGGAE